MAFLRAFELPDGTFWAFRAQNRTFCALLPFPTALFSPSERKTALFARLGAPGEHYSSLPTAKLAFLRAWGLPRSTFLAFRAQNRTFCALLTSRTALFRPFERKTALFARFWPSERHFFGLSSAKPHFLRAFNLRNGTFQPFRAQNHAFCSLFARGRGGDRGSFRCGTAGWGPLGV